MEQRIFSDILIKFFEKEQWADDFLAGKLYINQAGKFITDENKFRGDNYEGSQVFSCDKPLLVQFTRTDNGETIQLPLQARTPIKQSFEGANKVPIFCASGLNKNNFSKVETNKYELDSNYITYMEQFGKYAVMFSRKEFLDKTHQVLNNLCIACISGDVHYKEYDNKLKHFETIKDQYEQFFCKYISEDRHYDKQYEWRLILCDTNLIDGKNDHYELGIGRLKYATSVINTEILKKGIFSFHEKLTECKSKEI